MAGRDSLHQPSGDGSGLEADQSFGNTPLLPYEKQLIEILGCTEEEYKELLRFNDLRAQVRPAEYAHIPEIANGPATPFLVQIVIGLALTAAGMLLAPKPDVAPDRRERPKIRQSQLPNDIGPSRFNQTSSFDGFASLVDYGIPVAIPFGKMGTAGDNALSGGLVLAASLVWSRAYSYGTYQRIKTLYTLGEFILAAPQVRGVWLGAQSLSSLGNSDYALYWKSQAGENRIRGANIIGGSRAEPAAGDPETQEETFIAPIDGTIEGPGFCMVTNPQSKATFGQFNPIKNGTAYRVNWEVISAPWESLRDPESDDNDDYDEDAVRRKRAARIKVGGEFGGRIFDSRGGQPGVGRAYGIQMGLIAHAEPFQGFVETENKVPFLDIFPEQYDNNGNIPDSGTRIKYRINGADFSALDTDNYVYAQQGCPDDYGVTHKNITSSVDNQRTRADDLMTIGSKWMIGPTQWVLESRTPHVWQPDRIVDAVFKCVSTTGLPRIGLAGIRASTELLGGYEGPWDEGYTQTPRPPWVNADGFNTRKHCGAAFWNVVQYEIAQARMPRLFDTVEFGIKSTVWNQGAGLCSFNAIPTQSELLDDDEDNIQLNTPQLSRYFKRTSCFSIWVRPVPEFRDNELPPPAWNRINQVFCVTGDSPRAMYNYLRIRPRIQGIYEFRFIPRVGSDIAINSDPNALFWRLNAQGNVIGEDFQTDDHGAFRVTINGELVTCSSVLINEELITDPKDARTTPPITTTVPTDVDTQYWTTGADWHRNAWLTEVLGPVRPGTHTATIEKVKPRGGPAGDAGYIKIRVEATANNTSGPRHLQNFGTSLNWAGNGSGIRFTVVNDGYTRGQWAEGDVFQLDQTISPSNRYAPYNPSTIGVVLRVSKMGTRTIEGEIILGDEQRAFELASQVSDCSHYDEITKSCDAGPEHALTYINYAVSEADGEFPDGIPQYEDLAMIGMSLKSGPGIGAVEQPRVWVNGGIGVTRLANNNVYGVSNLLSDLIYYLLTNKTQGLGEIIPSELVDTASLVRTGKYLLENKIYWNGVVEADVNFRSFATDQAGKNLCIFTIKDGKFGMMPALPTDSSEGISQDPISVDGMFSAGNIIDGSFRLTLISAEDRRDTALQVRWRETVPYELPQERTAIIKFAGTFPEAIEDYDLTQFCDNYYQATMAARYALAARKLIDHTIEFQTTPEAVGIQPGSYIKVIVEETEFQSGLALKINEDMSITSPEPVKDGDYKASVYVPGATEVIETDIVIRNQLVQNDQLRGAIASLYTVAAAQRIYQVSELTLGDDGLVNVGATFVPTQAAGNSEVAYYTFNPSLFEETR